MQCKHFMLAMALGALAQSAFAKEQRANTSIVVFEVASGDASFSNQDEQSVYGSGPAVSEQTYDAPSGILERIQTSSRVEDFSVEFSSRTTVNGVPTEDDFYYGIAFGTTWDSFDHYDVHRALRFHVVYEAETEGYGSAGLEVHVRTGPDEENFEGLNYDAFFIDFGSSSGEATHASGVWTSKWMSTDNLSSNAFHLAYGYAGTSSYPQAVDHYAHVKARYFFEFSDTPLPAIPEPETYALMALGLGSIVLARKVKNRAGATR